MVGGVKGWIASWPKWVPVVGIGLLALLIVVSLAVPNVLGRRAAHSATSTSAGRTADIVSSPSLQARVATSSPPAPQAASTSTGDRLIIPSLNVDAHIENVGLTPDGNMDTPKDPKDVAWYAPGAVPGGAGDAVLAGHLDWYTGPAVFFNLKQINVGDTINIVSGNDKRLTFTVVKKTSVQYNQEPAYLFQKSGPPMLSLITCAGAWDGRQYQQRLIVDAKPA
jgi:sortase A